MPDEDLTNTELAILGLVAEEPKYGYQVEQDIQRRGMREWTEIGFSSIYYVLNKLEGAGLLGSEKSLQGDRPARKIYRLTEPGWGAYRQAVRQRLEAPRPRSGDFDLGLANLPALTSDGLRQALETHRDSLSARIARVGAKQAADRAAGGANFSPHVNVLFSHSLAMIEAELNWVEDFIKHNGGSHV